MQKSKLSLIMLIAASVIMCLVLAGGVLYAWILTNENVKGGIRVTVSDLGNTGVEITAFNGGSVPDDGENIYPGDKLNLEIRAIETISNFKVGLSDSRLTDELFEYYFKDIIDRTDFDDRTDLLYGVYMRRINGSEYDFDLESAMEGKLEEEFGDDLDALEFISDEIEREAERQRIEAEMEALRLDIRLKFLKKFADQNKLSKAITIKLLAVKPWDASGKGTPAGAADYFFKKDADGNVIIDDELMFTPPATYSEVRANMYTLPQWAKVLAGDLDDPSITTDIYSKLLMGEYNFVHLSSTLNPADTDEWLEDGKIYKEINEEKYVKIEWDSISTDWCYDIEIGYGIHHGDGHNIKEGKTYAEGGIYRPEMELLATDELVTEYGIEVGRYYANSYNCFSFQNLRIEFSTDRTG